MIKLHNPVVACAGSGSEVVAEAVQLVKKAQVLRATATKLKGVSPKTLEVSNVASGCAVSLALCGWCLVSTNTAVDNDGIQSGTLTVEVFISWHIGLSRNPAGNLAFQCFVRKFPSLSRDNRCP